MTAKFQLVIDCADTLRQPLDPHGDALSMFEDRPAKLGLRARRLVWNGICRAHR